MAIETTSVSRAKPLFAALAAFVLIVLIALYQAASIDKQQSAILEERLEALTDMLSEQLLDRITRYEYGLRAARGVIMAAGEDGLDLSTFRQYSQSRELDREFPGTRGFGFIRKVERDDETSYLEQIHQSGRTDFKIRELNPHSNPRFVIEIIEPVERNKQAVGLDIASELNRRTAAMTAMLNAQPVLTDPITLVQATGQTDQGLLFLLPVYRSGMPTNSVRQRRAAGFGFSYTPLVVSEVLHDDIFDSPEYAISIEDSDVNGRAVLMYSNISQDATDLRRAVSLSVYGQEWLMRVVAKPEFITAYAPQDPINVAAEIIVVGALFAMLVYAFMSNKESERRAFLDRSRMAAIVETSTDAIIAEDLNGYVTSWNEAATRIFGYPVSQAIGYRLLELIYPEGNQGEQEAKDILDQIKDNLPIQQYETFRRRSTSKDVEVVVSVSPILDENGTVIGAAHTIRDVTESHRSARMFRLALEASSTALLMINGKGEIVLSNSRAEQLFGYSADELRDMSVSELVPMPFRGGHDALLSGFMKNPSERRMSAGRDLSAVRKNGELVSVEINLNPVDTGDGHMVLTSIHDISHRVELEREVQRNLHRMQLALDTAGIGIWITDLESGTSIWDDKMFELYRVQKSPDNKAPSTEDWLALIDPKDRADVRRRIDDYVKGQTDFDVTFRCILGEENETRWFRTTAIREYDAQGTVVRIVGTAFDITSSKRTEASIREMNSRLSDLVETRTAELRKALTVSENARRANADFLSRMTYEIRTPMNAILGLCYLLVNSDLNAKESEMIAKIQSSGRQLLGTINDLLDLSKIDSGTMVIVPSPFRLSELLREIHQGAQARIGDKPIEFKPAALPEDT